VKLWVNIGNGKRDKALDIIVKDARAQVGIKTFPKTMELGIDIVDIGFTRAEMLHCSFLYNWVSSSITKFASGMVKTFIPIVTKHFKEQKIQLPDDVLGIFSLHDLDFRTHEGYIMIGLTPKFINTSDGYPKAVNQLLSTMKSSFNRQSKRLEEDDDEDF